MSEKMTTANSAEQGKVDIDFAECAVPKWSRRRFVTMFMIMLGFTFFSASMWVGQEMAAGLDFWGFIKALLLGGAILGIYTGLLGYVGAETGLSLDLLSKRAFGEKGSYISSALTSSRFLEALRSSLSTPSSKGYGLLIPISFNAICVVLRTQPSLIRYPNPSFLICSFNPAMCSVI